MKRIALPVVGLLITSVIIAPHVHTSGAPAAHVVADTAVTTSVLPADDEIRELKRASRSRRVAPAPTATPARVWHHAKPKPALKRPSLDGCTSSNWRSILGSDELWIDERESGVNPNSVNSKSGAFGLGQLLASTYRDLGLPMSSDPCDEIVAQRKYMQSRYGSWSNARAFWERKNWW